MGAIPSIKFINVTRTIHKKGITLTAKQYRLSPGHVMLIRRAGGNYTRYKNILRLQESRRRAARRQALQPAVTLVEPAKKRWNPFKSVWKAIVG